MSKRMHAILVSAVLLIVIAALFNSTFVAGGSAVVLLVAVIYAYIITKRDIEREERKIT